MRFGIGMKRCAQPVRGTGEHDRRSHARGSRPAVQRDARTHPADRSEGAAQAQAPEPQPEDAEFPGSVRWCVTNRPEPRFYKFRDKNRTRRWTRPLRRSRGCLNAGKSGAVRQRHVRPNARIANGGFVAVAAAIIAALICAVAWRQSNEGLRLRACATNRVANVLFDRLAFQCSGVCPQFRCGNFGDP